MLWLAVILLLNVFSTVDCEVTTNDEEKSVSTSVPGMIELLEIERQLLSELENYAKALEDKAALIRRATVAMHEENSKSLNNEEEYLSNPLQSYALIRRMHVDWMYWELYMRRPVGQAEINAVNELRKDLPTNTDMVEATEAIFRLQVTYDLETDDIASCLLNGKQYNSSLSSHDCFEIGRRLLGQKDNLYAISWLNTSLQRYEDHEINAILELYISQIIDLYAATLLKEKLYTDALKAINMALEKRPSNAKFLHKKSMIEQEMLTSEEPPRRELVKEDWSYYRCCRGEFDHRLSRLHCRYNTTTHPFLKLAPLKMEELKLDPYIVIYHDVISEAEIAMERTSKSANFGHDLNDVIQRIVQRAGDISGFDMTSAEGIQVINYGLGGHYNPHYDAFNVSQDSEVMKQGGDRIATLMFYLSDVEQGGATVFPNLNITVYPRKGSALMWYNLDNRGNIDENTLHAACPVIVGSKWVMTEWILERDQLFRRPCY